MKNKISIESVKKREFKEIVKIYIDSFSVAPFNERWTTKTAGERIRNYLKYLNLKSIKLNKKIVGMIIHGDDVWDKGKELYIAEMAVKKEFQGRGIGKSVIKQLEKEYKKKGFIAINLWTEKDSIAFKFYKKLGFNKSDGAVKMIKKLK